MRILSFRGMGRLCQPLPGSVKQWTMLRLPPFCGGGVRPNNLPTRTASRPFFPILNQINLLGCVWRNFLPAGHQTPQFRNSCDNILLGCPLVPLQITTDDRASAAYPGKTMDKHRIPIGDRSIDHVKDGTQRLRRGQTPIRDRYSKHLNGHSFVGRQGPQKSRITLHLFPLFGEVDKGSQTGIQQRR
jgi:hypothetical protein